MGTILSESEGKGIYALKGYYRTPSGKVPCGLHILIQVIHNDEGKDK